MIYIGNFLYVSNQQEDSESERRHGDFALLVEAETSDEAIELFRNRLTAYKEKGKFFEGECRIYFVKLMEFDRLPRQEAFMFNFKSYAGDPILPFIECAIPSSSSDGCKISEWQENVPAIEGRRENAFITFPA